MSPETMQNNPIRRQMRSLKLGESSGLLLLLIGLFVLFSLLAPENRFLQVATVQSIMFQLPELGLLSLAMTLPLISGGLNLAIIATMNSAALLMAWMMGSLIGPEASGLMLYSSIGLALLAGLAVCLLIGYITGILVAKLDAHPILITLGMMTLLKGIAIYFTRGAIVTGVPEPFLVIANGTLWIIPLSFLIFLGIAGLTHVYLTKVPLGIESFMVGSNREAAAYSGVNTEKVLISTYVISGALCWCSAVMILSRFNSASSVYGESYLLVTILAAILGGIDPFGGFGKIKGLVLSLLVLQVISSGFNLLGLSQHLTLAFWGITLVLVIAARRVWGKRVR